MERLDFRRDKSKPMPLKGKQRVDLEAMVPGRVVNVYDMQRKTLIGPGLVGMWLNPWLVDVVCFPMARALEIVWVQPVGALLFQQVGHASNPGASERYVWAWPHEHTQLRREGWE